MGDLEVRDEAIHLAAALQAAGTRKVRRDDVVGGRRGSHSYCGGVLSCDAEREEEFDPSRAARALRAATRATRDRIPLYQQTVFIHIRV